MKKQEIIAYQLALAAPQTVEFEEGGSTLVTPAHLLPVVSNFEPVRLEGAWEVTYWPFAACEEALLGGSAAAATWTPVCQPGKIFYADPEQLPDSVANWNRVTMEHHDPEDGALIRRQVTIPEAWSGQEVLLRFDGIYPAGKIYWDGEQIAEQWSGLTPRQVNVTDRCRQGGTHTIAVRLYRRHRSIALDMPRHALEFVGLHRPAFLHVVEPVCVADLRWVPELTEDYRTGTLAGEALLRNTSSASVQAQASMLLADEDGRTVAEQTYSREIPAGADHQLAMELAAGPVEVWNDERPYLYTAIVRLVCPGQREQVIRQRVGFRRFELNNERPTLNGNPVKFRGVNHLTFHPAGGLYTPEPWLRECLTLMKRANVNTVRTHYLGPSELTDLCDELGLYLLQELPIDWGHPYVHDPVHLGPILHRMEAGVRRDRNHPAVMAWCLGNENIPWREADHDVFFEHLRLAGEMVRTVDPSRPIIFPPPGPGRNCDGFFEWRLGEIGDIHYSFALLRSLQETGKLTNPRTWEPTFETHTREEMRAGGWSGVWFCSEYGANNQLADLLNAPYTSVLCDLPEDPLSGKNSLQVFIDRLTWEWGYMRDDPTCLGGAYFPWIAGGSGDPWGWERWGEDADWGVVTQDLTPKPAFWAMRTIFSPVQLLSSRVTWTPGDTEIRVRVRNLYNGWDLSECTLRTQSGGGPPWMGILREWRDVPMAGAPGATVEVVLPLWNPATQATLEEGNPVIMRCTVLDPRGFRALTADVLVVPEQTELKEAEFLIGPDVEAYPVSRGAR